MAKSTVGELRKLLDGLPDDMPLVEGDEVSEYFCGLPEVIEMVELQFGGFGKSSIMSLADYEQTIKSWRPHIVVRSFKALGL